VCLANTRRPLVAKEESGPYNLRTMKYDTKRTLKVQYQNNEAQDTNKERRIKKNPGEGYIFRTCPEPP
jgi:hypothetical protein